MQAWWADPVVLRMIVAVCAGVAVLLAAGLLRRGHALAGLRAQQEQARGDMQALALRETEARTRLDGYAGRLGEISDERDGLRDALHAARDEIAALGRQLAETRLAAQKDRAAAEREMAMLRDLREEMTGQFRLMADESLRRQGADLEKTHGERLAALLTPFREQVQVFQSELQARNRAVDEERAALREQIEGLHRRSEEIGRDAVALTRALKGEKQRQGAWGEMILERVLEASGLERGTHYETQESWQAEDGKTWRPDVVVRMPRRKVLVIDSKVSLNDYEIAVNAESEAERAEIGAEPLPTDLGEAVAALEQDDVLMGALGEARARTYLAVRRAEWEALKDATFDEEVALLLERY